MEPPKQLVKTWVELARIQEKSGISDDVQRRAAKMLRDKVGNMEEVLTYIDQHNLIK